jgi:hypothetical protein
MFGSEVLEIAAGIIFIFLLVSIIASAIREGIEAWLKTRATHLELGIRELLHDPTGSSLVKQLFDHPLIYSLYSGSYSPREFGRWPIALTRGKNLPSYIPSRNFALALMDMAARGPIVNADKNPANSRPITLQAVRANLRLIQNPPVQRALLAAIDTADDDLQKALANVEAWYDSVMDRVSGWYKRATQWILFAIGLAIAIALNVNAIAIGDYLYRDKAAREALVARAQAATSDPKYPSRTFPDIEKELSTLTLPIGGTEQWKQVKEKPFPTLGGWLLTAIAASLGAPFWFDLLNKIMVIRSTVKPNQKSSEESSEDRQTDEGNTRTAVLQGSGATSSGSLQSSTGPPATVDSAGQMDGCDVKVSTVTKDEDLPLAEGGVG